MVSLIRDTGLAAADDMNVAWLLPYTRPKNFKAGSILMEAGEYATAAYYLVAGEVQVVESKETFGKGTLLGEIGLFTPDGRRTKTVWCKTDVQTAVIDYDRFKELYFQNPQFGFRLLHLIVARLQHGHAGVILGSDHLQAVLLAARFSGDGLPHVRIGSLQDVHGRYYTDRFPV